MASFRMEGARVWGEKDPSPRVVWIKDDRVVEALPEGESYETVRINDSDAWIAPGFIDSHVHVFKYVTGTFGTHERKVRFGRRLRQVIDRGARQV